MSYRDASINDWRQFLYAYKLNPEYENDFFALETCKLALEAVELGNFGIGCIVVNPHGAIVAKGHNQVFYPYFRSDRHGEMVVMDQIENTHRQTIGLKGYTLYTSLESCPMCMARLIISGCETIIHVADDPSGGMVHLKDNLPPMWIELARSQNFVKARCATELEEAAQHIFLLNAEELNERLRRRSKEK
jgi:tRNA(Arg) A34 adenosine deaminase TadA